MIFERKPRPWWNSGAAGREGSVVRTASIVPQILQIIRLGPQSIGALNLLTLCVQSEMHTSSVSVWGLVRASVEEILMSDSDIYTSEAWDPNSDRVDLSRYIRTRYMIASIVDGRVMGVKKIGGQYTLHDGLGDEFSSPSSCYMAMRMMGDPGLKLLCVPVDPDVGPLVACGGGGAGASRDLKGSAPGWWDEESLSEKIEITV